MGFSFKKVTKSITKPIKKAVKSVGKAASSYVTAGIDGVKAAANGDLGGIADAATRAATYGTVSLGDKGILKANLTNQSGTTTQDINQQDESDGLLAYVNEQRNRKAKRNRASTNNTNGSVAVNGNQLSGTTALGV